MECRVFSRSRALLEEQTILSNQAVSAIGGRICEFVCEDDDVAFRRVVKQTCNEEAEIVPAAKPFV